MMRSSWMFGIAVFISTLLVAFSIVWYSQALAARRLVVYNLRHFNSPEKAIAYDHLELSGFPKYVRVKLINPRFTSQMDSLFSSTPNKTSNWQEELALKGDIVFEINVFSTELSAVLDGFFERTTTLNGKNIATTYTPTGTIACLLERTSTLGLFSDFWDFTVMKNDNGGFDKSLKSLDCTLPDTTSMDGASHALLASYGPGRFYVTQAEDGDHSTFQLYIKTPEEELSPAGIAAKTGIERALGAHNKTIENGKNILLGFAQSPEKNVYTYTIVSDGNGYVINGNRIIDLMALLFPGNLH